MSRTLGAILREAREARGITLEALARQLNLPSALLIALEEEDWLRLPSGRERPLARQVAERLGLDPAADPEVWARLPGEPEDEALDPRQERLERRMTVVLTLGAVAALVWLLLPGPRLRRPQGGEVRVAERSSPSPSPLSSAAEGRPYPVLGEAIPEVPLTEEGVLVVMRTQDPCQARIVGEGVDLSQTLQVSHPWKVRVKGPFQVKLVNAGVVALEVGGRRVRHGQSVGEPWEGRFEANGAWLRPAPKEEPPPTLPEPEAATEPVPPRPDAP